MGSIGRWRRRRALGGAPDAARLGRLLRPDYRSLSLSLPPRAPAPFAAPTWPSSGAHCTLDRALDLALALIHSATPHRLAHSIFLRRSLSCALDHSKAAASHRACRLDWALLHTVCLPGSKANPIDRSPLSLTLWTDRARAFPISIIPMTPQHTSRPNPCSSFAPSPSPRWRLGQWPTRRRHTRKWASRTSPRTSPAVSRKNWCAWLYTFDRWLNPGKGGRAHSHTTLRQRMPFSA